MSIKKIIFYMLAVIFRFIPRNKHLWLTGKVSSWGYDFTPPQFFDNSKYFYLYLVENTKEKVYWISSSKKELDLLRELGLPVVKFASLKGIILTLRAKVFFHHYGIDQIDYNLQHGSVQIDMWHGTPIKKIRFDVVPKQVKKKRKMTQILDKGADEYLLSTSEYLTGSIYERAFDMKKEKILNYGYPRTDIFKLNKEENLKFCGKYSKNLLKYIKIAESYNRVLLYMPTWRDDDPDYFAKANIDFLLMSQELKKINGVLFLKLHPLTQKVNIGEYDNIYQIDTDVDIYPFLMHTDFLITDYSSIMFDYLLLNKEIIFIPYDYDNYISNRELYYKYEDITPGKKYYDFNDFIKDMYKLDSLDFSSERSKVKNLFIDDYKFDACEKLYNFIKDRI